MFRFIDRLIEKLTGDIDHGLPYEEQYSIIRNNIIDATYGRGKAILITSSQIHQDELSKFANNLAISFRRNGHDAVFCDDFDYPQVDYKFASEAGMQKNARAIELARVADGAVIVEVKGKSIYPQIERCMAQLADVKCEILGCVLCNGTMPAI